LRFASTTQNYFDNTEIALLIEAANDISFALENFEKAKLHEQVQNQVIQNQAKLSRAQSIAHIGHWELDLASGIAEWSDESCRIYGIDPTENNQSFEEWKSYVHPDDIDLVMNEIQKQRATLKAASFDHRIVRKDGSIRYVHSESFFELDKDGNPFALYGINHDITGQKEAEEKIKKANRLYAFTSAINQSIVHINNEEELLNNACIIAKEIGLYKMAWIGLLEGDAKMNLTKLYGTEETTNAVKQYATIDYSSPLLSVTPTGKALSTGKYALSNDLQNDPEMATWKADFVRNDIKSTITFPLTKFGKTVGVFGFYSLIENFFDIQEINLLQEAAGDISFALENFEKAEKQKDSEELVEKNEKRFRALIERSNEIIVLFDETGKLKYISPSVKNVLGYSEAEFVKLSPTDLVHPEDIESMMNVRKMVTSGKALTNTHEHRVKHKNGSWIWVEAILTNMLNEDGINALVSNSRDITERKAAEQQLEFDQNNLNALINNTTDLMWSIDLDFNLITANQPFIESIKQTLGKDIKQGSNVLDISYTPEMVTHFKQTYLRAFNGESFTEIEYFDISDGIWFEISYCPIRNGIEIIGTACHSRDITTMKKAEKRILASEAFSSGVLRSLSSHIAVIDTTGKIVAANEAWNDFALKNGETTLQRTGVGSNYFSVCERAALTNDTIAIQALRGLKEVMAENESLFYLEYPCHSPTEQRWFGMRAMKFDSDDQMVVVAHEDITRLKMAKQELAKSLLELEHRVEERTKDLADKNKDILDSINYAKRIQLGLLPRYSQLTNIFPKSFILSLPRDIVSGDFFWCHQSRSKKFIAVADCTGHGVPGALMSIIGNNLLEQIIVDEHIENPSEILELLDLRLTEAVKGDTQEVKDGMDITLCVVDSSFNELYFAGAYQPLFKSDENQEINELVASRFSIGAGIHAGSKKFETKRFSIIPGQRIYLSSDGYYSQFGGVNDKKLMKSGFRKTLDNLQSKPMTEQKNLLKQSLSDWTGKNEQVDDILVVGIEL